MIPPQDGTGTAPRALALLDHRGEDLGPLQCLFQDHGWQVQSSTHPEGSVRLLADRPWRAAIVAPLTLSSHTLEWEQLLSHLSPAFPVPWLVLPWSGARPSRVAALLSGLDAVADWLPHPWSAPEAAGRIDNLLRMQGVLGRNQQRADELAAQLITDHKTGLANDRHFRARLEEEFERTDRHGAPLTLLLLDLDDFKAVNDSTSYEFGDTVLRTIGEVIRHSVRTIDIGARIGGDEFAILMPNTNLEEGIRVASRILNTADGVVVNDRNYNTHIHLSIGTATFEGHGLREAIQLFLQANEALKAAKAAGKHQVCFFDPNRQQAGGG